ncbi:MAG: methyl-accepting chemotaxis protein [Rhodospirillaceae bacterium]
MAVSVASPAITATLLAPIKTRVHASFVVLISVISFFWLYFSYAVTASDEIKQVLSIFTFLLIVLAWGLERTLVLQDGILRRQLEEFAASKAAADMVVEDISRITEALAKGNLACKIKQSYPETLQKLKDDLNAALEKLNDAVGRINRTTSTLAATTAAVAEAGRELSKQAERQADNLEQATAAMSRIAATVRANAERTHEAELTAAVVRKDGEHGSIVAGMAIEAMKRIAASSHKITDIISVIDDIAFQTNMLSLNAAVEAARAGEAGHGFAVVAQEVRFLARRSAQASKEIKDLIMGSDAEVRSGVEMVGTAGGALRGTVHAVEKVALLIEAIASGSREESRILEEIDHAVTQMGQRTRQNIALAEDTSAVARTIHHEFESLQALTGFFATNSPVSAPKKRNTPAAKVTRPKPKPRIEMPTHQPPSPSPELSNRRGVLTHADEDQEWKNF